MRRKVSSSPPDCGHSSDMEYSEFLNELFTEGQRLSNTCVINQTRNTPECMECQKMVFSIRDYLNLFRSYRICEDCGEILSGCWNNEKPVIQNPSPAMHISIRLSCSQTKNIDKKINVLESKLETLGTNIQQLDDEYIRLKDSLQRLSQECSSMQNNFPQQKDSIHKLNSNQNASEQNLLEIQQKMEDYHYATYDGSLIWKITEVGKKSREARSGQRTSMYSPVFHSSPNGYKMRARLDLYGDGAARGTHMSVFLVILRGEYDNILPWPFNFPVNFCLFNQTGQCHHIIDSFYPDTTSNSSQKPCSQMNIASGILRFCPLTIIEQQGNRYVQNDTMFIKIMIDFLGIPRPVLPYTMSLNPGLPTHVQENISRREMEQYKQLRAALVEQIYRNDQEVVQRSLIHARLPVPAGNRQQPPPSATNSQSISCEDILDD